MNGAYENKVKKVTEKYYRESLESNLISSTKINVYWYIKNYVLSDYFFKEENINEFKNFSLSEKTDYLRNSILNDMPIKNLTSYKINTINNMIDEINIVLRTVDGIAKELAEYLDSVIKNDEI